VVIRDCRNPPRPKRRYLLGRHPVGEQPAVEKLAALRRRRGPHDVAATAAEGQLGEECRRPRDDDDGGHHRVQRDQDHDEPDKADARLHGAEAGPDDLRDRRARLLGELKTVEERGVLGP
jgi:hypothetical protein